jgi:hypothetical protein
LTDVFGPPELLTFIPGAESFDAVVEEAPWVPVDEVSELEDDCLVDDSSASDLASEVLDEEVDEDCDAEDDDEDEEDEDESLSESALAGPAPWLIVTMTPTPRATANVPTRPT